MKKTLLILVVVLIVSKVQSQDTLPQFTIDDRGERTIISWINPYTSLVQLNVQRSYDSLKYYTTIYSATSPNLPQNGFSDRKVAASKVFYRIFYVFSGGSYFFSRAKRAGTSTGNLTDVRSTRDLNDPNFAGGLAAANSMVTVTIKGSVFRKMPASSFGQFRDSILKQTRDTLFAINDTLVGLSPYVLKEAWRASSYVYVNKEGYINISLPSLGEKKYSIKFFEESGNDLFEIKSLKESPLILDKSNFVHAGWVLFELYEDNILKEKNKFYVPKDF